ncbi:hypothetical protein BDN72DRAFT_685852 [Pluteus cervinus]|uniref:Uncharacterized protein n=1 Tax=Pluteus cervinus TaxID=181527 RepID=A0ACD3ASC5_9AGAR|nr:hypothetical protein BDN72DRAFT_685852 [Pluteus cervinus]
MRNPWLSTDDTFFLFDLCSFFFLPFTPSLYFFSSCISLSFRVLGPPPLWIFALQLQFRPTFTITLTHSTHSICNCTIYHYATSLYTSHSNTQTQFTITITITHTILQYSFFKFPTSDLSYRIIHTYARTIIIQHLLRPTPHLLTVTLVRLHYYYDFKYRVR